MANQRQYIPNDKRAVINGRIATYKNGKRIIATYKSGDPLQGDHPEDDAPPFTGYVRGFGKKKGRSHDARI